MNEQVTRDDVSRDFEGWKTEGKHIGVGGFGKVYKISKIVKDQKQYAALKIISIPKNEDDWERARRAGCSTDASFKTYFNSAIQKPIDEADRMANLRGVSNVVQYLEHHIYKKEFGADIVIFMELLTPLKKHLEKHAMSRIDVVKLGLDICAAISACHEKDIVHKDIKEANLFIDEKGYYKLGDFGSARESLHSTSAAGEGTDWYRAPELITKNERNNKTIDIYALGIVLYRLLNGNKQPFVQFDELATPAVLEEAENKRIYNIEPLPVPRFADEQMAEIIFKALAYDRRERYQSAEEMATDLLEILSATTPEIVIEPTEMPTIPSASSGEYSSKTIPDLLFGSTEAETEDGTMPDIDTPQPKKSKKGILIVAIIAILLLIGGSGVYLATRPPQSIPVIAINGVPESAQLIVGETHQIILELLPVDTTSIITYTSSNTYVAEINSDGYITARDVGTTFITVTADNITSVMQLNVIAERISVEYILGVPDTATLTTGQSLTLQARVSPYDATESTVTYTSSNPGIATVGADGVITAVSAGSVTITAYADGVYRNMALTVNAPVVQPPSGGGIVAPPPPPPPPPPPERMERPRFPEGDPRNYIR